MSIVPSEVGYQPGSEKSYWNCSAVTITFIGLAVIASAITAIALIAISGGPSNTACFYSGVGCGVTSVLLLIPMALVSVKACCCNKKREGSHPPSGENVITAVESLSPQQPQEIAAVAVESLSPQQPQETATVNLIGKELFDSMKELGPKPPRLQIILKAINEKSTEKYKEALRLSHKELNKNLRQLGRDLKERIESLEESEYQSLVKYVVTLGSIHSISKKEKTQAIVQQVSTGAWEPHNFFISQLIKKLVLSPLFPNLEV